MLGEVGDVSNLKVVCSTDEHLCEAAENMSSDSIIPLISEDLLNEAASGSMNTIVDKSPNGQCDQSSPQLHGTVKEEVKLNEEAWYSNRGTEELVTSDKKTVPACSAPEILLGDDVLKEAQDDSLSEPATGTINEKVNMDSESGEGNHRIEELITIHDRMAPSSLAPENTLSDDNLMEAQHNSLSEPATGTIKEEVNVDAESGEGSHGIEELITSHERIGPFSITPENHPGNDILMEARHDCLSEPATGTINGEVNVDAQSEEGNHRIDKFLTSDEITAPSSLALENPLGDVILIDAQHDSLSEPATESGIVTEVAAADNQENTEQNVLVGSLEFSLHSCANNVRQTSIDFSGVKVAEMFNFNPVEAKTGMGGAITQEIAVLREPNVPADAAFAHEKSKETLLKENQQDKLPVIAGGDRSTECHEPLSSSSACTETSKKENEIQHAVTKQSDSNLNSSKDYVLVIDKEISHLQDPEILGVSKKDDSFSVELPNTSDRDTNKVWQPISNPQASAISGTVVGSPVASSTTPKNKKRSQKISQGVTESSEPKRKRSTARKGGKKGDQPDETTLLKQLERDEIPAHSLPPVGSSLSTLNFSISLPAAFQQPFTDLQQLQLRAQIFVYGSLIQVTAPDEACLISAFGGPDGGRSIWEKPWRKCLERIHNQMLQTNMRSPVLHNSGKSTPDQTSKQSVVGNKRNASLLGPAGKSNSSQAVNSMIPFSSPHWNMHTSAHDGLQVSGIPRAPVVDYNPLSPLHPLQTPTKNMGHATSWSPHAPLPLPWAGSAQTSAWDHNISLSALSNMEPVKLIPVKESSLISYSTANHSSADPSISIISASAISSDMVGGNPTLKSLGQISEGSKSKKRKKVAVYEDPRQVLKPAPHSSEAVLANSSNSIQPVSVKATPLSAVNVPTSSTIPLHFTNHVLVGDKDADRKNTLSEDTLHRVNEAKLHAEEAAACAEAAVSHSQHVWGQLETQKNSGLTVDLASKVASAAVAIAAAASVAKAAAAAAKLASNAALQAKLMIEESLVADEYIKLGPGHRVALCNGADFVGEVTPASILKGENRADNSSSIIGAAKEAARRKIESALAASKHAENLDAIVKAAELAAEAVAQAGKVVAMGDPLPLSALVESGPEGYWKLSQGPPEQLVVSNSVKEVPFNNEVNDGKVSFPKMSQDERLDSGASLRSRFENFENQPAPRIASLETNDCPPTIAGHVSASIANEDLTANAMLPPEYVSEKKSPSLSLLQETGKTKEISPDTRIEEGSIVEVFKEWGAVKAAWFAARVLDIKDEEVYVSYIEKQFGDEQCKEWINLSCEDNTAPIVRIAHPMVAIPSDAGRKRRRTTIGSRSWEVGDKVDAWMKDCWWEGIIIEKNSKDESSSTVQFPAQGETCVVKAWNLRSSLIWKDGLWVQWSNPNKTILSRHKDDAPRQKRQKLSSPQIDVKGKGKASESSDNVSFRVNDRSRLMGLSEHEKTFNVGKSTRDNGKINALRIARAGLQKEGSNVIFGVPKPGKKRKFMDVSTHFDAGGKAKIIESNEPHKTSRLPIARGLHGWINSNSRTESRQKTISKYKPKVLKSAKTSSASGKSSTQTDASDVGEGREMGYAAGDGSASGTDRQAEPESCSNADEAIDDTILISSLARPPNDASSKRSALGNMKSERASKGKLGLSHTKMADSEEDKVVSGTTKIEAPDASEPRRSNRRIQPTSRLLEGLQTSLTSAKVPSTGDRSFKSHNKNASLKGS